MLLRRITEHVKSQNWFAVSLDFFIVVVGVFIGIQVANWNDVRSDQARSEQYLERIATDLSQDTSVYADRIQFWGQVADYGMVVLDSSSAGGTSLDAWELLLAYFQASQAAEFFPSNATFEELKSAGELGLIQDAKLRSNLAEYYTYPGSDGLRERPRYREHVRSIIPIHIQFYIWENCYQTNGVLQTLKACPSPITQSEVQTIIDRLQTNETLHEELRYWVSSLEVAKLIVQEYAKISTKLHDVVIAKLGHQIETAP